ncbi:MAG: hypothetical protein ACYCWW_11050 [Deltaproteobacteria bacterium]
MALAALLALVTAVAGGLAPLGPSFAALGDRFDLVARPLAPVVRGKPTPVRLLFSDAATDAPQNPKALSVVVYGPNGSEAALAAQPDGAEGRFVAAWSPGAVGGYALVARGQDDIVAVDGLLATPWVPPAPWRPSPAAVALALALVLGLFGASRALRPLAAAVALALCASGDARAHGNFLPPAAAIPGAEAWVAQELQFALGLRTTPAAFAQFDAPAGSGLAPREELALPRSALVEREGRELVFVRTAPETFVAREPRLGWRSGTLVAVLSGVVPGERVVTSGAAFLRNGGGAK